MIDKKIPEQHSGASSVTKYEMRLKDANEASSLYKKARLRLLDVNGWHKFAGKGSAKFTVVNKEGDETNQEPVEGNYLRINIPLVPHSSGEQYEWVIVEKIGEQVDPDPYTFIQVRPSVPPFYNKNEVAHFFSKDATSTFSIEQKGNKVIAQVNGRNEKPNKRVHSLLNKMRNIVVAILAMIGLNKPQWKRLVKGLLEYRAESLAVIICLQVLLNTFKSGQTYFYDGFLLLH